MEVAAQLRRPGHAFQQVIGERGGFDRGNADAVEAGHGLQPADHVRQRESLAPVPADVDAGHNHFVVPSRHEALGFPDDLLRAAAAFVPAGERDDAEGDRKSTRLNSSHGYISYAVFCLKKKKKYKNRKTKSR